VIGVVGGLLLDLVVYALLPRRYEVMTTFVWPESLPPVWFCMALGTQFTSETLRQVIDRVGHGRLDPEGTRSTESLLDEIRRSSTFRFETVPKEPGQPSPPAMMLRLRGEQAEIGPIPFPAFCGNDFIGNDLFPRRGVSRPAPTMITLRLEGERPEVLPDLASEILRLFRNELHNWISEFSDPVVHFLETELKRVERDLNVWEKRIRDLRREDGLPGRLPGGTAELGRFNDALRSNLEAQEELSREIAALLRTRKLEAEPSQEGAESGAAAQRQLMIEAGEIYAELTDKLDRLREEEGNLRTRIVVGQAPVASPTNQKLIELTRGYDALQTTQRLVLRNLEEASRASELQSESVAKMFEVMRPPMTRRMMIWPDPRIVVPGSVAIGVSIALLLILCTEIRPPKLRRTDSQF